MSVIPLLSLREAERQFGIGRPELKAILARAGYSIPNLKRGESLLVAERDVEHAIAADRERRTVKRSKRGK